jgi:hypothetical protein
LRPMMRFEANIPDEKRLGLEQEIERRVKDKEKRFGDVQAAEKEAIGDLLNYGRAALDDISYDHYNARKFVKMFPEPDVAAGQKGPCLVIRLYQKVVRRLLRQQIVYNESVLGVLEETERRVCELEKKLEELNAESSKGDESA